MSAGSIIGAGTVVRGNVRGEGPLEILGRVEGDVTIDGDVLLGEASAVRGNVSAAQITVGGRVLGNLDGSEAVLLEAGARVAGDIMAPRIGITSGALVRGNVRTEGESELPAQQKRGATASVGTVHRLPQRPVAAPARPEARAPEKRTFERRPVEARPAEPKTERKRESKAQVADEETPDSVEVQSTSGADSEAPARREPPPPVVPALPKGTQAKKKKSSKR